MYGVNIGLFGVYVFINIIVDFFTNEVRLWKLSGVVGNNWM